MDAQVGRVWEAIKYREAHYNEEWLIFITTDHRRDEQTGKGHGGQSPRQRSTWMVTNYNNLNAYARWYTPGIIDITPSISTFMGITLPIEQTREVDGMSLIGQVSVAVPQVNFVQGSLDISWKALDNFGKLKIWVAASNNFKDGKPDNYQLLAEVPVADQHVAVSVKNIPSDFYKVVIEAPYNTVNRWILLTNKP